MMTESSNAHHMSIELVERFAQCLLKDCKTKNDINVVKELGSYVLYFSNEIKMNQKRNKIFEDILYDINSATVKPDCNSVLEEFKQEIDKTQMDLKKGKNCEAYVNFMKMISEYNLVDGDDDDAEIQTVSETVNTVDPISKLPLVDPVKNKKCGHVYEKNSILQLIQQNPRTKCPIPGCDAGSYVKKSDLVPDNALKRMLNNACLVSNTSGKKMRTS